MTEKTAGTPGVLREGSMSFTIESRILRELGERLVRQPEVAVVELVKNAYDADATECSIVTTTESFTVQDDGLGMTLEQFTNGWMRVGTSSKSGSEVTEKFGRRITGEKGIGRFAVRFLGGNLSLESIAFDPEYDYLTRLSAQFDWADVDASGDLEAVRVPYRVDRAPDGSVSGTRLEINDLRPAARKLKLPAVRSGSLAIVSPLRSLIPDTKADAKSSKDPGFRLLLGDDKGETEDLADRVLDGYNLRAQVKLTSGRLRIDVVEAGNDDPIASVSEKYETKLDDLVADIRFFPRRSGQFSGLGLDGRAAYSWVRENSGVAVFDKGFRVSPYGQQSDDWLLLTRDAVRNSRIPESSISKRHFPMTAPEASDTAENWMLRLPEPLQLIGAVRVNAARDNSGDQDGVLVPAADREGFLENQGYSDLFDIIRGAVEAIAYSDRYIQRRDEEIERKRAKEQLEAETVAAIQEINEAKDIPTGTKKRLIAAVTSTAEAAKEVDEAARSREQQLEIMSLLGVVAGFMTHEFGSAIAELRQTAEELERLSTSTGAETGSDGAASLRKHIENLEQYVQYSTAYIRGSGQDAPNEAYAVLPRIRQTVRVYGDYARDRGIEVELGIDSDLMAPKIPVTLYSGVALNLFTNALKAVTGSTGADPRIALRSWNERGRHVLEVSDTGVGIPPTLRERVFDPLFTTTASRNDPLGSGMGLGLSLVRRTVEAFGGRVEVVDPPPGFNTAVRVSFPISQEQP